MRIALDGLFERAKGGENPLARGEGEEFRQCAQVKIVGCEIVRRSPSGPADLLGFQRRLDHPRDADRHLVLEIEHVFE